MKHLFYLLLIGFLFSGSVFAVNTDQIELVRERTQTSSSPLSEADKDVITRFWTTSLDQMLLSETSQDAVEIRMELAKQKGTEPLSSYRAAYVEEGLKGIQTALENIERLESAEQQIMAKRNLIILTANLESPKTSEIALAHLADKDDAIRYWAVKAVTQPAVIQQLSSDTITGDTVTAAILEGLSNCVSAEKRPEILEMIAGFCMAVNQPTAQQILGQMIDRRIDAYQNWLPVEVGLDIRLLSAAGSIATVQRNPDVKSMLGRKFAQMYALVIQRYMQAAESLTDEQLEHVLSVIAEVDQNVVLKVMEIRTGILQGLKTGSMNTLNREYEVLFGDRLRQGELAIRFKFDYGKDASGKPITCPPDLKPMPEKIKNAD